MQNIRRSNFHRNRITNLLCKPHRILRTLRNLLRRNRNIITCQNLFRINIIQGIPFFPSSLFDNSPSLSIIRLKRMRNRTRNLIKSFYILRIIMQINKRFNCTLRIRKSWNIASLENPLPLFNIWTSHKRNQNRLFMFDSNNCLRNLNRISHSLRRQ